MGMCSFAQTLLLLRCCTKIFSIADGSTKKPSQKTSHTYCIWQAWDLTCCNFLHHICEPHLGFLRKTEGKTEITEKTNPHQKEKTPNLLRHLHSQTKANPSLFSRSQSQNPIDVSCDSKPHPRPAGILSLQTYKLRKRKKGRRLMVPTTTANQHNNCPHSTTPSSICFVSC
jgi:hypothetical protein